MYARLTQSDSDDYYEGVHTMNSKDVDAFTFHGYILSPDLTPDHILANQEKFHIFNRTFNSDKITIDDFEEKGDNYVIKLMTNSVYQLVVKGIEDDILHFTHSMPHSEWVTMAACTHTFPKAVQINRGWC